MRHVGMGCFTAGLELRYRKRLRLLHVYRVTARIESMEGRKVTMKLEIRSGDDDDAVHIESSSTFVRAFSQVPTHDETVAQHAAIDKLDQTTYEGVIAKAVQTTKALYGPTPKL